MLTTSSDVGQDANRAGKGQNKQDDGLEAARNDAIISVVACDKSNVPRDMVGLAEAVVISWVVYC